MQLMTDSYARLGLATSACIVRQITSDAFNFFFFPDDRLLALHNRALDFNQSSIIIEDCSNTSYNGGIKVSKGLY